MNNKADGMEKDERSTAEKALSEIQGIEKTWPLIQASLWSLGKKHPFLFTGILLVGLFFAYDYFYGVRTQKQVLEKENADLTRKVQDQQAIIVDIKQDLGSVSRERDEAKNALAPWVLLANSVISNVPPDKRLDLLLGKVEPIARMLESIQSLTNSIDRKPEFELWVDGLRLSNGIYVLPVDSNKVAKISFRIVNSGNDLAQNLRMRVAALTSDTNVQVNGHFWEPPPIKEDPTFIAVTTDAQKPLNPGETFLVGTLNISPASNAIIPFQLTVSSGRAGLVLSFICTFLRGDGKLVAVNLGIGTNALTDVSFDFRRLKPVLPPEFK